jgi:HSP20 family protein
MREEVKTMLGLTRWNAVDDFFIFQRQLENVFDQFWNELPGRTAAGQSPSFQATTTDDGWRIDVPLPGIDPRNVNLDVAGHTLTIRAEQPVSKDTVATRYEQSFTVPQFLDVEKIGASYRHGMLQLTLPLKDSVKPRRIQIEGVTDQKQIASAA